VATGRLNRPRRTRADTTERRRWQPQRQPQTVPPGRNRTVLPPEDLRLMLDASRRGSAGHWTYALRVPRRLVHHRSLKTAAQETPVFRLRRTTMNDPERDAMVTALVPEVPTDGSEHIDGDRSVTIQSGRASRTTRDCSRQTKFARPTSVPLVWLVPSLSDLLDRGYLRWLCGLLGRGRPFEPDRSSSCC
jgi:hypothetical protein